MIIKSNLIKYNKDNKLKNIDHIALDSLHFPILLFNVSKISVFKPRHSEVNVSTDLFFVALLIFTAEYQSIIL